MWIVLIWLVLAVVVGALASAKDRSGFGWFVLAVFISPLIAGFLLLIAGDSRPARCPYCDEKIKARAKICPHCRTDIAPMGKILIEGE
jgi:hypothetical protein